MGPPVVLEGLTYYEAANRLSAGFGDTIQYITKIPTLILVNGIPVHASGLKGWDCECGCKNDHNWSVYTRKEKL